MALSLSSSPTFLCASFSAAKLSSKSHKSLTFSILSSHKNHPFVSLSSPSLPFCLSHPLLLHNRHDFSCFVASQEDSTNITEEETQGEEDEETEDKGGEKMSESVETLTRFYKEAVLAGDDQTISDIETVFYRLESEKNDLVQKVSTLSEEITAGKERYIRLQADFDNFRKRSEKERLSVRSDAQGEVIETLLGMVDNFERAKQQLKPETDREKQIDTSYQGIYKQFVEIMRSLQVAAVETVGKPFDPSLHEAIAREESEEFKEGIVMEEFRRGFLLGDRLLRPAMVKVSAGPGKTEDTAAAEESSEQPAAAEASSDQPAAIEEPSEQPAAAAAMDEH